MFGFYQSCFGIRLEGEEHVCWKVSFQGPHHLKHILFFSTRNLKKMAVKSRIYYSFVAQCPRKLCIYVSWMAVHIYLTWGFAPVYLRLGQYYPVELLACTVTHSDHIPSIYHPYTNHIPSIYQPHTIHIPTTFIVREISTMLAVLVLCF